jgi:hypothetical protein
MTTATMTSKSKTCADMIDRKYERRHYQFNDAYEKMSSENPEIYTEYKDYSDFWDYLNQNILDYSYVEENTFNDQPEGYWRLQFSWGGPSDEIRYYTDEKDKIKKINYVYMDWFDGASLTVRDDIWYTIYEGCR